MAISININEFQKEGGEYEIVISKTTTNRIWSYVLPDTVDWVDVQSSEQTGVNDWTILVNVAENTGPVRQFHIVAETEAEQITFVINQEEGVEIPVFSGEITYTSPSGNISDLGGTLTVDVKVIEGNDNLTTGSVTSGGAYCTLTSTTHGVSTSAGMVTRFVFTYSQNSGSSTRSASFSFTVSDGVHSELLTLSKTQNAASQTHAGTTSVAAVTVGATSSTALSAITCSNMNMSSLSVTSKPSWVTSATIQSSGSGKSVFFEFPENDSTTAKAGAFTVSGTDLDGTTVTATNSITQNGIEVLGSISVDDLSVLATDIEATAPITTENIDMSSLRVVSASYGWVTVELSVSSGQASLVFSIAENEDIYNVRTASFTVFGTDVSGHSRQATMTLLQAAAVEEPDDPKDFIYKIDYDPVLGTFTFDGVAGPDENCLYAGNLNFSTEYPIETITHFETEDIQKIYWVDGRNVLRFMNFNATADERTAWDNTSFDSNKLASFDVEATITKDNSGNTRANGVVQYLLTYFNKHGQETGAIWMSDIVYLSPIDRGGREDGTNQNMVTITFKNLDTSFNHFRVYSIFRSTLDGEITAYLVSEQKTASRDVVVVDDGAHLTLQESSRILYLGSQPVIPGTMTHKDNTLFIGDLKSIGHNFYNDLEACLKANMFQLSNPSIGFQEGVDYLSSRITFVHSTPNFILQNYDSVQIPYVEESGNYPYSSQLQLTSSEILSFKGGEKYRFGLKFKLSDGTETEAFWIGDAENTLYPIIDETHNNIQRVVARCELPAPVITFFRRHKQIKTVQLMIAEASYADRSVKAQGIVTPTMFNTWERFKNRTYAVPSWMTRVRGLEYASRHFSSVDTSQRSTGEIQCNWWAEDEDHGAYYQYQDYDIGQPKYFKRLSGETQYDKIIIAYRIRYIKPDAGKIIAKFFKMNIHDHVTAVLEAAKGEYIVTAYIIRIKLYSNAEADVDEVLDKYFTIYDPDAKKTAHNKQKDFWDEWHYSQSDTIDNSNNNVYYIYDSAYEYWLRNHNDDETLIKPAMKWKVEFLSVKVSGHTYFNKGKARTKMEELMKAEMLKLGLERYFPHSHTFHEWCVMAVTASNHTAYVNQQTYNKESFPQNFTEPYDAINPTISQQTKPSRDRWINPGDYAPIGLEGESSPAYYKKHLMFVDENVVTLDSPELEYEAVQFDEADYKFRIVGIAKMSSVISDYTVDASHSSVPGVMMDTEIFSGSVSRSKHMNGVISWPLWKEYGLYLTEEAADNNVSDEERTYTDYEPNNQIIRYWMYMWHHKGSISGFAKRDNTEKEEELTITDETTHYSELRHKTWANLRFAYKTIYLSSFANYNPSTVRMSYGVNTNWLRVNVGGDYKDYTGSVQMNLSVPGNLKYPVYYSDSRPDDTYQVVTASGAYLYSSAPVLLEYATKNHAVISLMTSPNVETTEDGVKHFYYEQEILPYMYSDEYLDFTSLRGQEEIVDESTGTTSTVNVTGAMLPWIKSTVGYNFVNIDTTGGYIANPSFSLEGWSDAGFTNLFRASGSGPAFDNYATVLRECVDMFGDEDIYIPITVGESVNGMLVSGVRFIANVNSFEISYDESTGIYNITAKDPSTIAYANAEEGYDDKITVYYKTASYNISSSSVEFSESGTSGELDVQTGVITDLSYPYREYRVSQQQLRPTSNSGESIDDNIAYVFIGEIYRPFVGGATDTRYGGITSSAIKNNRFIAAGPVCPIYTGGNAMMLWANQGDTYFQRYDSLRVIPFSEDATNKQIDIASMMIETHINLDGRTDLQRGINELASIDVTTFGQINKVYSQKNNFVVRRDLDDDYNTDSYRSSVTWTLPHADMALVDEWTHITLGATIKLDGDKGICRALRRFNNDILAFQDRGVSEILFNEKTQLSTQDGVPVEIGNSGKVSGKRYVSNKYGCINKWSITEGKTALYFVDNINKAFCNYAYSRDARGYVVSDLSTPAGFSVWFKSRNSMVPWNPSGFNNLVSFYDKVHSDIYLVKSVSPDSDASALVYSEQLGAFSSFYDYGSVPMMVNLEDKFISFRDHKLWLQNEGKYCNFFGIQYNFWTQYRVTPDPYGDKIWTNLEYRADFYRVLNEQSDMLIFPEHTFADDKSSAYQPNETFDFIRFWNEYQTTEDVEANFVLNAEKKFRIWRVQIPRAKQNVTYNPYGLDRIRNPWLNILIKKKYSSANDVTNQDLMQMHDMSVIYFE